GFSRTSPRPARAVRGVRLQPDLTATRSRGTWRPASAGPHRDLLARYVASGFSRTSPRRARAVRGVRLQPDLTATRSRGTWRPASAGPHRDLLVIDIVCTASRISDSECVLEPRNG